MKHTDKAGKLKKEKAFLALKKVFLMCFLIFILSFSLTACEIQSSSGRKGDDGKSAYQIWLDNGGSGTEKDFLNWLKGLPGTDGESAYQIWVDSGNTGTEEDFLNWLKGLSGTDGKSAYQIWLDSGNTGTEEDFLNWLKGETDKVTVIFDTRGGSVVEPSVIKKGGKLVKPKDPSKPDYIFDGWYADNAFEVPWLFVVYTVPEDITLYAKWILKTSTSIISTKQDLMKFADRVNGGDNCEGITVELSKDINLDGIEWTPIGGVPNSEDVFTTFAGTFEGNGFKISNMTITSYWNYIGFFRYNAGIIKNLILENIAIEAIFDEISSEALVPSAHIGGLAAYNRGEIENCFLSGFINVTIAENSRLRGLDIGGLVRENRGKITNCHTACRIEAKGFYGISAGGLVGYNYTKISKSSATGNLNIAGGNSTFVGGLAAHSYGNIINSYATGNLTVTGSREDIYVSCIVGGLVGDALNRFSTIINCYAAGNVNTGTYYGRAEMGGLAGSSVYVENCFAFGNVTSGNSSIYDNLGGLVGDSLLTEINNSYRYSGQIFDRDGSPIPDNTLGEECSLSDLNDKVFYTDILTWDDDIWDFNALDFENGVYPTLK